MLKLVQQLVHDDPTQRPSAAEAYQQFKAIRQKVSPSYSYILVSSASQLVSAVEGFTQYISLVSRQ